MSRLDPVIKLRKQELDELRRQLVELEEKSGSIQGNIAALDASVKKEQEWGAVGPGSFTLGGFIERTRQERERLEGDLADNEEEIEACRDEISEAFQEMKKFEIARERQIERDRLDDGRREQATLDEIASQQHSRSKTRAREDTGT